MSDEQLQREEDDRLRKIDRVIDQLDADASDDHPDPQNTEGAKHPAGTHQETTGNTSDRRRVTGETTRDAPSVEKPTETPPA